MLFKLSLVKTILRIAPIFLILVIVVLLVAIGYESFLIFNKVSSKQTGTQSKLVSELSSSPNPTETIKTSENTLVFLVLAKNENFNLEYDLFKLNPTGGEEEKIWSESRKVDFDGISVYLKMFYPNKNRELLSAAIPEEGFLVVNSLTKEKSTIPFNPSNLFLPDPPQCTWNNLNTKFACFLREDKPQDSRQILAVVDITNKSETILVDSLEKKELFKEYPIGSMSWDKTDENLLGLATESNQGKMFIVKINVKNKDYKVTEIKDTSIGWNKYSSALNKFITLDKDKKILQVISPENGESVNLYNNPDHYIHDPVLTLDERFLIFTEVNFKDDYFNSVTQNDEARKSSIIIRINLENNKIEKFEYPIKENETDRLFSQSIITTSGDNVIFLGDYHLKTDYEKEGDQEFIKENVKFIQVVESYNLVTKEYKRIFSREIPDIFKMNFDVLP